LRTPKGTALPPNTRAELHRDMARLRFVTEQIQQIEAARSQRLEQAGAGPNATEGSTGQARAAGSSAVGSAPNCHRMMIVCPSLSEETDNGAVVRLPRPQFSDAVWLRH
jgi:hypothetical protein